MPVRTGQEEEELQPIFPENCSTVWHACDPFVPVRSLSAPGNCTRQADSGSVGTRWKMEPPLQRDSKLSPRSSRHTRRPRFFSFSAVSISRGVALPPSQEATGHTTLAPLPAPRMTSRRRLLRVLFTLNLSVQFPSACVIKVIFKM